MQALTKADAGKTYTIKWLVANYAIRDLFDQMGLIEGQPIKLVQKFYGSVLVTYNGRRFGMSQDVASRITVG